MPFISDLDTPLFRLSPRDAFTLRDACAGVHIFGGIGSGKTSGSGRMLAGAYLRAGMGGLFTAVKPEDIALYRRYAAENGRSESLLLFDENEGFNFLAYELARQGMNGIGAAVECLMCILEAARSASGTASKRGGEPFWDDAMRQALRYVIPLIYAADGTVSIESIIRCVSTAPNSIAESTLRHWQERSVLFQKIEAAKTRPKIPMEKSMLDDALDFWGFRWPAIPEKTRGNIVITVTSVLDRFMHGRLRRAFCGKTTVVPEMTFHGVIIVLAMPTLTWNEDGIVAQILFKYMWQRAVLSRNSLAQKHRERPVFCFSDESQSTVHSHDGDFLSMCRGSKCCVTYMTQSLPNYFAQMTGDNPRDAAFRLVGKFSTHVYHSNACSETNEFAAKTIGRVIKRHGNYSAGSGENYSSGMSQGTSESDGRSSSYGSSTSRGPGGYTTGSNSGGGYNNGASRNWGVTQTQGTSRNTSQGYTEGFEYLIEPGDFGRTLKTGGTANQNIVTGVWYQSGRVFEETGTNVLIGKFRQ